MKSVLFIHLYVHHLQQRLHLFEVHLTVFVLVSFQKPISDPSEKEAEESSSSDETKTSTFPLT